jgi:predicted phosphodiesterase
MSRITIVHISDIHIHSSEDRVLKTFDSLRSAVYLASSNSDLIIILVSGDIAFSGKVTEYEAISPHFHGLAKELSQHFNCEVKWIMVPGNHDGTFKNALKTRSHVISGILNDGSGSIEESEIEACTAPQQNYFEFESKFSQQSEYVFKDKLLGIKNVQIGGKTFSFWEFNASWLSRVPEQQGSLVFPIERYQEKLLETVDFRFAVLHHPLNWYAQDSYHVLRKLLTNNFSVVFSGHEHITNGHLQTSLSKDTHCLFLEAGALAPHDANESSCFSVFLLNTDDGAIDQRSFTFNKILNAYSEDIEKSKQLNLQISPNRKFQPTLTTSETLEELGAPFTHPARDELKLSDVYIEPEFSEFNIEDKPQSTVKSREIYKKLPSLGRLLIRGDEHHGKTSFLNQLFSRALTANVVPVRLSARELSKDSEEKRDRLVEERVGEHYGRAAIDHYRVLDRSSRLILVDDLDYLGVNAEQYERTLNYINRSFGQSVITISERFDVSLLGSTTVATSLGNYDEYKLLGFTYAMRSDLIRKWYSLDLSLDTGQLESKAHEAQTQIDYAVAKALIPSTAFNTLMLLNAIQTTQKGQVVDAGVAQHYDSLIRRRLADSGIPSKELDGIYAYLAHMAWWLRTREISTFDSGEITTFNRHFTAQVHPIRTEHTLDLLVKARILTLRDGAYQFRHPSARYFFLAHYIAERSDVEEVRNHALTACRRLYKKDNANLVVFLASKVGATWIVKEVAGVLADLLKAVPLFSVVSDSKTLNSWVSDTAKLAINVDIDQHENRRQAREQAEAAQADEDGRVEVDEVDNVSQLDVFTQINLVFKTSEILGLILKSKYGSLEAKMKNDILQQLFDGPLRAISYFLGAINEQPDALIEYLSNIWADKMSSLTSEQRTKLVKKYLYFALGAYSQALLQRQGEIAGSPDLTSYVQALLERAESAEKDGVLPNGTLLTYRLLSIASRLSYPGDLPFSEIERAAKEMRSNPFGFTLLQGLVGNHLYMFPVAYDSRQKLAEAVDLDLRTQVAKEVTAAEGKVLPSRSFKSRNAQSLLSRMTNSFLNRNKSAMEHIAKNRKPGGTESDSN